MAVSGADQLARLGVKLKVAGAVGLKTALSRELKGLAKPLVEDVRQAARKDLPKKGGLNEWVATGRFTTSVRFTGPLGGMTIKRKGQFNEAAGTFRHPVFGHRDRWVDQTTSVDWFFVTLEKKAPDIEASLAAAMDATAAAIARL